MSLVTRNYFKDKIKKEYLEYKNESSKLLKNKSLNLSSDFELKDIYDVEELRFSQISTLIKRSRILF